MIPVADYGFFTPQTASKILTRLATLESAVFGGGSSVVPQLGPPAIYVHNVSGEEIPAYACMQCTGTEVIGNRTYIQVNKPADSTGEAGGFLFNSPRAIAIDGNGVGFAGPHVKALGDGSAATAGDRWAPVASNWEIADSTSGFLICIGDDSVATDVVRCVYSYGANGVMHFVSPSGGIPARSSLTMGSASCDVYLSSSGGVLSDSSTNETVYNMASSAFGNSTHGIAARNDAGLWVAIVEDCGA